jgi:hypothetical protein
VAKHRKPAADPPSPASRPARELVIWGCFGCAVVPLVLLWSGTGWRVAVAVGGLVVLLALGCAAALRFSGISRSQAEPPISDEPHADDRQHRERP